LPAGAILRIGRLVGRLVGQAPAGLPSLPEVANKKLLLIAGSATLIGAFAAAAIALSVPRFPLPEGGLVRDIPSVQSDLLDFLTPELSNQVTETSLPPLPLSLATDSYTVAKGDTLGSIAAQNHVDIDTLVSMNNITSAKGLGIGQVLKIPNMKGIVHVVVKGESLALIAKTNKVTVTAIADANNLGTGTIIPGQAVFIPGARLPAAALRQVFGDMVIWPVKGIISSWFGYRPDPFTGVRSFHGGLDLAIPQGTPVKAAMDGRIADVGYNQMFGNYVIINHDRGLQTLYGHLSRQEVHVGQAIAQGQILGLSGNTGYSTAPHLHFGVYRGGVSVNPLKYLPGSHP
jgi:murein DD-endopeptidase MepM/ murein hydrolase activator NlpD